MEVLLLLTAFTISVAVLILASALSRAKQSSALPVPFYQESSEITSVHRPMSQLEQGNVDIPASARVEPQIWSPTTNRIRQRLGTTIPSEPVFVGPPQTRRSEIAQPSVPLVGPSVPITVAPTIIIGPEKIEISRPAVTVIRPSIISTFVVSHAQPTAIEPPQRGAWDERGWTRRTERGQEIYEGMYTTIERRTGQQRSFGGRLVVRGTQVTAYIADPPIEIKKHPHGPCFQLHRAPWFQLHWRRPARNPDDALLYVERVLNESING